MPDSFTPPDHPDKTPRRGLRDRWRVEVMRTSRMGDAAKLLLIAMCDQMDSRGYVSVPRPALAASIGRSERRVSDRLSEAVEAGFLDHVVRGQKGVTPVYRAMLPDSLSETVCSPLKDRQRDDLQRAEVSPDRPAETTFSGTHGGPTTTRAPSQNRSRRASAVEQVRDSEIRLDDVDDVDPSQHLSAADLAAIERAKVAWGMSA